MIRAIAIPLFFVLFLTPAVSASAEIVLVDRYGQEHTWNPQRPITTLPVRKDVRATVLFFMGTTCPLVNKIYAPVMKELHKKFKPKGVQFLGIYSNSRVTRMAMAGHKQKIDLPFPTLIDEDSRLAKTLGAERTPEAFLLDRKFAVKYRGMIDDSAWEGANRRKKIQQEDRFLENALNQFLSGKDIELAKTKAKGCDIEFPRAKKKKTHEEKIKYYPDVERIVQTRCTVCHYTGGIGPDPFETYEEVRDYAETIGRVVRYQRMPPWHSDVERGRALKFVKQLSDKERELFVEWVEDGAIEGDRALKGKYAKRRAKKKGTFSIGGGKPDYAFQMTKPFTVPATEDLDYQFFWVPTDFEGERWIKEVEIIPGDDRVVHHAQVHLKEREERKNFLEKLPSGLWDYSKALSGAAIMADFYGFSGEEARRVAAYLPGNEYNIRKFPEGQGIRIPAGMDLVFELHYTSCGEKAQDQSKVGFVWADEPPKQEIKNDVFFKPKGFEIPAYDPHHQELDEFYFKTSVQLLDVRPHMHLRGSDYTLTVEYPDGREELLLAVPAYDFNWQHTYVFEKPVKIPARSSLKSVAHWDNSRLNPNNPDPSQNTTWGQQSEEEMDNIVITYTIDEEADRAAKAKP